MIDNTYDDDIKIIQFYDTPTGKKLIKTQGLITRHARAAGEEMGRKLADEEWLESTFEELKLQFPQWFNGE